MIEAVSKHPNRKVIDFLFIEPTKQICIVFKLIKSQENRKEPRRQFANRGSSFVSLAGVLVAESLTTFTLAAESV